MERGPPCRPCGHGLPEASLLADRGWTGKCRAFFRYTQQLLPTREQGRCVSQRLFQCCKEREREVEDEGENAGGGGGGGEGDVHVSPHTPVLKKQNLRHWFSKA